ncbi:MotA/TolQ/ExbB proton channel family protein [Haliangium ochraceum]|uniref:MotA/TolQ/ExbB proton channel n=1 Tax=Haliangium ochraceum (strain DSM 14365 / JCM 11303 / SMP-2) TaxID=502025 RepID=D0LFW8_HALO1|nr:MotA/TolQ/ExbB proton channel family protein [Haliangium ochraceum]ACY14570.1 MotA/TolQ/ExbB proton channel [Haliangium ochraceum DSM 14365]
MTTVETIKSLFVQSGAGWVLWLLFALSAGSVAVFIERLVYFRSKSEDVRALAAELDAHLASGAYQAALDALRPLRSVGAAVARAGLRLAPRGSEAADKGMQSAIAVERKGLDARLTYLGTLGNNAPFIGLFGTVIGVILAFEELGQVTGATGAAASQVASAAVMSAIAEALVATAVGIGVALPAVAAYNFFQRRISVLLDDAETLSNLVLAYLGARSTAALAAPSEIPEEGRGKVDGAGGELRPEVA